MITSGNRNSTIAAVAVATLGAGLLASPAAATNGYFANGFSVQSKGMAGAGVAVEAGVMGLANNPAMGTRLGRQFDMCASAFGPDRSVTISPGGPLTAGTFKSENPWFLVPCMGINLPKGDRASLSFMLYGNGGMNTEYTTNFFAGLGAGTSPLGVNLEQLFLSANYAYEINDSLTVGIAPILAFQRFEATGLQALAALSSAPAAVSNTGENWSDGFGFNIGMVYEPNEQVTIGAAYRSKINMSKFDKYAGLFAGGGDFDIPATATLGVAFQPTSKPGLTLTAEFQRIFYGDVAAISNSSAPPGGALGTAAGAGFGWVDMDVIRLAGSYQLNQEWTLRGGISHATDFISSAGNVLINTLAPATPAWHASIGATRKMRNGWTMDVAYSHAFDKRYTGANPAFTRVAQNASIRMDQHEISFGLTKSW